MCSTVMGQLEANMRIPIKKRPVLAAGNAASTQPITLRPFGVCPEKAALTKVIPFAIQLTSSG